MISIITYCHKPMPQSIQERNVAKTIGTDYEYLVIDGSKGDNRFAAAYNWAVAQAKGDIVVFILDDLYFMNMNWGKTLITKFSKDPTVGVIGVAGTQFLYANKYSLTAAGRPFIKGRVVYHLQNGDFFAVVFSPEKGDAEVVVCDGCCMAVRKELLQKVPFDNDLFSGAHFYDLDFCLRARQHAKIITTSDLLVKRMSQPLFDASWHASGKLFLEKHIDILPASCVDSVPPQDNPASTQMVNLKGKTSPVTIC